MKLLSRFHWNCHEFWVKLTFQSSKSTKEQLICSFNFTSFWCKWRIGGSSSCQSTSHIAYQMSSVQVDFSQNKVKPAMNDIALPFLIESSTQKLWIFSRLGGPKSLFDFEWFIRIWSSLWFRGCIMLYKLKSLLPTSIFNWKTLVKFYLAPFSIARICNHFDATRLDI